MQSPVVGIIANPVSARDIRRVISHAGNMPISDRANVVLRLMAGLAATGVEQVVMMPEKSGICGHLTRDLKRAANQGNQHFPQLEILDMPVLGKAADSACAAKMMREMGVAAIIVLGGDGTHRVVVSECGDIPIASVSTGTNNAFPEMREPTVTGLAVGLAVVAKVAPEVAYRFNKQLEVQINDRREIALVDVAIVHERYVGARAIWKAEGFQELFVAFADPASIGMSAIVGLIAPVGRDEPFGYHIIFNPLKETALKLSAPIAPGLMDEIGIAKVARLDFDQPATVAATTGTIAFDGEREISFSETDSVSVVLREAAFKTIDISACMAQAAANGLFVEGDISSLNIQH